MTVIVRNPDGRILVMCKGADSIILPLLHKEAENVEKTVKMLEGYSKEGLRTLLIAEKEISEEDYKEGIIEVNKANKFLNRYGIHKYINLLARNWAQVKYSEQIFAIGTIIKPGSKNERGYYNKGQYDIVDGGTGYAVMMGVNNQREIFVFDQIKDKWFRWSYSTMSFIEISEVPSITSLNFAGIGSRELAPNGLKSIRQVYEKTFKK